MYYASTVNLDFIVGNDGSRKAIRQKDLIQLICIIQGYYFKLAVAKSGGKEHG